MPKAITIGKSSDAAEGEKLRDLRNIYKEIKGG